MDQLSYPCGRAGKKYINRKATAAQKNWIYSEINESRATPKSIERDYCFKQDTVEKWVAQKNKGVVFTDLMGRPPLLDEKNVAALTNKMTETSYKPTDRNYAETLHQQMQINAQEHNKSLSSISYPTRDTKRRYKVKIIAKSGKGKKTTAARATAVADIRNAISFGVMNQIMVNAVHPSLILNSDATQYAAALDCHENVQVIFVAKSDPHQLDRGDKIGNNVLPDNIVGSLVQFFIKYYLLMNALGNISTPVYIIADEEIPVGQFRAFEVQSLAHGVSVNDTAYVVLCKSRAGNEAFYIWFNQYIMIPFVLNLKRIHALDVNSATWYQLDGEEMQIRCYEDISMLSVLENNNIIIGKPSGSTTEITQPCDRGNVFKASKKTIKSVSDTNIDSNPHKVAILTQLFINNSSLDSRKRKLAVYGLIRVQIALQQTIRMRMITDSFAWTGIYPFNISKILSSCSNKPTYDEELNILSAMPRLVVKFKNQGELYDQDFDEENIKKTSVKDHLVTNRRRSIILTSHAYVSRNYTKKIVILEKKLATARRATKRKATPISSSHDDNDEELTLKLPRRNNLSSLPK
jgi:hypothetical protein